MPYIDRYSAGALRYRIRIQRPVEVKNQTGETVLDWEDYAERWASIESLSGREVIANSRQEFTLSHRVVIRGSSDGPPEILPQFRIWWGDRHLEISSVLSVDRGRWIEMLCSEVRRPQ